MKRIRQTMLFFVVLFSISTVSVSSLEAVESFHLSGILVGANSSQKTLYINQGEPHNISLMWNLESKFFSFEKKAFSSSIFIKKYKGRYVGLKCIETKKGLLILEAVELNMES